jgi:hypothetical protein
MALTKWDADLIDGLDEAVDGDMEDYLPLEGGTLTGELTVDANLILEGSITKGQSVLEEFANSEFTLQGPDDSEATTWPQIEYILSPSRGKMQHLTVKTSYDGSGLSSDVKNSLFVIAPDQSENISEEDQDYFFEDGQSMTIRIEFDDLDAQHKADRHQFLHRWHDDIWWVNTKDGLAPDLNETGAMTINLWKAKGIVYGKLAGDFVKQPEEYHPDAFDFSKLDRWALNGGGGGGDFDGKVGHNYAEPNDPIVWNPEGGIQNRQGTAFARTSRDGRHCFIGQSGSDGWYDWQDWQWLNGASRKLYPGELRVIGNDIAEYNYGKYDSLMNSPLPQPFSFRWEGKPHRTMPSKDSKLLGSVTDMRLRVDKGTGVDFKPDGTKIFQSVACYYDPSLKDKYKNVIGAHHLSTPWDVGTTDFLSKEKLNDIIYCDEKYSDILALHPEHPDMRVCCLTFRPDGMGFYFAYVLHSLTNQDIEYYFVQQDLTVPWELSSAKEEYKYSDKIFHKKAPVYSPTGDTARTHLWQINGMTVTPNGKYMHAVYPHNYLPGHPKKSRAQNQRVYHGLAKPRQFEMTTPWDISTAGMDTMHVGIGGGRECWEGFPEDTDWPPQIGNPGCDRDEMTHAVHWNESGESCYFSYVPEHEPGFAWGEQPVNKIYYKQNKCVFGPWGGEIADTRKEEETQ